jgi:hypothetical protein
MADLIPPMMIKLQADVNDLKVGLAKAESAMKGVDDSVKKASTGMTNFMSKIKQVGSTLGVAFAGQQIVQFSKDIVMAASDMNETLSKTAVIFGDGFDKVNQFAETSANTMGMSKKAALDASSTFALFGKSAGLAGDDLGGFSGDLVKLSADFASFYNTSPEDAIGAIGAALRGESEPIRKYNILINEASLKQEALRMGLIKTTTGALDPQTRVLAAHALILKQSKDAQGDFARTADGAANTMRILSANMENAKAKLGAGLLPAFQALLAILKPIIAGLAAFGTFLANNKESVTAFIVTITALSAAWGVYTLVVKRAAIQQAILNGLQAINPIGAIVIAVGLLVAAMVKLWNSNESFRKAVVAVAKVALNAFAAIIPMVGQVFEAIMKISTGPLRLLLTALSHLPGVGKYAKAGLDLMNKGLNGISDFANGAAKKAKELSAKLDGVAASAGKAATKTKDAVKGGTDGTSGTGKGTGKGGLDDKAKKKLEGYQKDVLNIYKDMNDVIAEAQDKAASLAETRNEALFEAHKNYDEKVADLQKNFSETMIEAQKNYDERVLDINQTYAKKAFDLEKAKNDKLNDLQKRAQEKSAELTKAAAEKQASIIQQSIDRLRSAFGSKTGFDIGEAFGTAGGTTGGLIDKLKTSLTGAKTLQKNAGMLAGKGYSQTFIEQVVKQGPEIGNKLSEELLKASDEQTRILQESFMDMEAVQQTGLDALAQSMNNGANLATSELRQAYDQVAIDLKAALATVDQELLTSMAEANLAYNEAMTEAKADRDASLADALKTFTEAKAKAQKILDEGLAEAQKTLQEALLKAQQAYDKAIDELNKSTQKKLDDLKAKLAEVAAQMAALGAAQAAAAAMAAAPVYTSVGTPFGQAGSGSTSKSTTINNTTNITGYNLSNPNATAAQTAASMKLGSVVTVNTTSLAGVMAASNSYSGGYQTGSSNNTSQGTANKLKAMGLL